MVTVDLWDFPPPRRFFLADLRVSRARPPKKRAEHKHKSKKMAAPPTCHACGQDISHVLAKEKEDAGNNRGLYPLLWVVECEPSRENRCRHKVGYFTTEEEASKAVIGKKSSETSSGTWYYSFCAVSTKDLSDKQMTNLNPGRDTTRLPY